MTAPTWADKSTIGGMKKMNRIPSGPVYYNSQNTVQILFQSHGSIWLKVLPYCMANVFIMIALHFFNLYFDGYLRISVGQNSTLHTLGGVIVSFLCITRLSTALDGYNQCREYISIMFRETRELTLKAIVYSGSGKQNNNDDDDDDDDEKQDDQDDQDDEALNLWRIEFIYRSLLLLRTTVINIEFPYRKYPAYKLIELGDPLTSYEYKFVQPPSRNFLKEYSIPQSVALDSFRVPLKMEQLLRETISNQKYVLNRKSNLKSKTNTNNNNNNININSPSPPLMVIHEEMNLHASVDQFMIAFYGIRKFVRTPIPFPLVQMAHTIGLLYVFTLPLVFLRDKEANIIEDCFNIFLLTYGFYGVMITSIVLDDPFASSQDANCFDVSTYSLNAIDDALILISGMCNNNNNNDGDEDGNNKYCTLLQTKMNIGQESKEQHYHVNHNNKTNNGIVLNGCNNNNNNNNNISYGSTSTSNDDDDDGCETGQQQQHQKQSLLAQSVHLPDSATVPGWMRAQN